MTTPNDDAEQILREEIRAWLDRQKPDLTAAIAEGAKEYLAQNVWWCGGYALVDVVKDAISEGTRRWLNDNATNSANAAARKPKAPK